MAEALSDPQLSIRGVIHRHDVAAGIDGGFAVPLAAFTFAHGGPRIESSPPRLGQHNAEIFAELGFGDVRSAARKVAGSGAD